MRGRNESTRAVAMANHHCFAFNCTKKKQKNIWKIPGTGKCYILFHSFRTRQVSIVPWECQNEGGVCVDGLQLWIAACRLNSLNVMRHTGTCSVHFEGDRGRTKLDPVSSIFASSQYLQRKPLKSRRAKAAQGSQGNTTQTSKNKKVFTSRKRTRR